VLRLPFILHSSYPHEILHNWWGNGVYVDYPRGNWSEGLTAYLADHLLEEIEGRGAQHRRAALQKYLDYVAAQADFPLIEFRARHSEASQAVGYGKAMMVFHMLRQSLGDQAFVAGLRALYAGQRFRRAGWADLQRAFAGAGGRSLDGFFGQWLERPGAPALALQEVRAERHGQGYRVEGLLLQTQDGPAYALQVPLALALEGEDSARLFSVPATGARTPLRLDVPARPLALYVDPAFDLFRRLDRAEVPPSLGQLFGAGSPLLVLPAAAAPDQLEAYRGLARAWGADRAVLDEDLQVLPQDRPVWLLGRENRHLPGLAGALADLPARLDGGDLVLGDERVPLAEQSVVLVARHPRDPALALGWLHAPVRALPGLARKLPHYGKYSYLVFTGTAPDNRIKGQWPVVGSPLQVPLAGRAVAPPPRLPDRPPLARLP
jgi:hypothetical protein